MGRTTTDIKADLITTNIRFLSMVARPATSSATRARTVPQWNVRPGEMSAQAMLKLIELFVFFNHERRQFLANIFSSRAIARWLLTVALRATTESPAYFVLN
jgi:hypothetical protein